MARTKKQPGPTCEWREDSSGDFWDTACGEAFSFIADGPRENKMRFCPYCGRALKERG